MPAREETSPLRPVVALAVGVLGVFAALIAGGLAAAAEASPAYVELQHTVLLLWFGGASALALGPSEGRGPFAQSLAGPASARWLAIGLATGLAAFALNRAYVEGLRALLELEQLEREPGSLALALVGVVLLAPLLEEWLCRGVLWAACRRALGPAGAIFATAAAFGVLHGLDGPLAIPHRFAFGLALGWLRARSGSLGPPILAHAGNNLLAVVLP